MPSAVILAGGRGERFWPMTHAGFPKYRIRFAGKKSLLRKTADRLSAVYPKSRVFVVTTREDAPLVKKELPGLPASNIFIEPSRKNTGPAIFLSTAKLAAKFGPDEVVSFFPADHLIEKTGLFRKTIRTAIRLASRKDNIVTIGIKPDYPATGFGYIKTGKVMGAGAFAVARFVEKPDLKTAKKYVAARDFLWNGGIFTWRAKVFLDALKKHSPGLYGGLDLKRADASYRKLPSISIDYALLEKADNLAVIRTTMDWCDLGSWDMLLHKSPRAKDGSYSEGLSVHKESKNSLLINQDVRPLITLGLSDLIVVQTARGTLVCRRGRAEEAALLLRSL